METELIEVDLSKPAPIGPKDPWTEEEVGIYTPASGIPSLKCNPRAPNRIIAGSVLAPVGAIVAAVALAIIFAPLGVSLFVSVSFAVVAVPVGLTCVALGIALLALGIHGCKKYKEHLSLIQNTLPIKLSEPEVSSSQNKLPSPEEVD